MSDERDPATRISDDEETCEDLLEQAQANAQATIIATITFLNERAIPPADWVAALGRIFGRVWGEPEPWEAGEFLDAMLANYRSLGAEVVQSDLQTTRAEATIAGFPDPALCADFGVDPTVVATFNDVPAPIAAARSLTWHWSQEGEETRFVVTQHLTPNAQRLTPNA